eukprot:UN27719
MIKWHFYTFSIFFQRYFQFDFEHIKYGIFLARIISRLSARKFQ